VLSVAMEEKNKKKGKGGPSDMYGVDLIWLVVHLFSLSL
jgi:hypothetical protein